MILMSFLFFFRTDNFTSEHLGQLEIGGRVVAYIFASVLFSKNNTNVISFLFLGQLASGLLGRLEMRDRSCCFVLLCVFDLVFASETMLTSFHFFRSIFVT